MIYPSLWPNKNTNTAEAIVYNKLYLLKHKYDIFHAKKFVTISKIERSEYEVNFIICIPNRAVIFLEVKGGIIKYDGISGKWYQNSNELKPGPDAQASSATHSLINRYKDLARDIQFGWVLCFPDCEIPHGAEMPSLLSSDKIIDHQGLLYIDKALDSIFQTLLNQYPEKAGCRHWQYNNFKNDMLRGIGFVQVLSTIVKHDNEQFIQLAEEQVRVFKHVIENNRILVYGPAESGKTIVAKTLAQEVAANKKKVVFCCFNRTLANKLAYEPSIRNNDLISIGTFHSFAKRTIEALDSEWWNNAKTIEEDLWDIEVPAKLDSLLYSKPEFDYLIIDEGQDFKEFWFELLFRLVKYEEKIIIFLDKMQDIFNRNVNIPLEKSFFIHLAGKLS